MPIPAEENDAEQVELATKMMVRHQRGALPIKRDDDAELATIERLKTKVQAHHNAKRSPADMAARVAERNKVERP